MYCHVCGYEIENYLKVIYIYTITLVYLTLFLYSHIFIITGSYKSTYTQISQIIIYIQINYTKYLYKHNFLHAFHKHYIYYTKVNRRKNNNQLRLIYLYNRIDVLTILITYYASLIGTAHYYFIITIITYNVLTINTYTNFNYSHLT